jgi:hypothetical protein
VFDCLVGVLERLPLYRSSGLFAEAPPGKPSAFSGGIATLITIKIYTEWNVDDYIEPLSED